MKTLKYFLLLLLFTSCKSVKNTIPSSEYKNLSSKQLVRKVNKSQSKFKTYQAKAKFKINSNGARKSYGVSLRIKKNEAIWLSSAAGIVRALLTQDSIYYYNKLDKKYLISDYKALEDLIGLNLNYNMVENILLSQPINGISNSTFNNKMSKTGLSYIFNWDLTTDQYKKLKIDNFEGIYKINRDNFKLDLCSFKVFNSDNIVTLYEIQYLDFTKIKNQSFTSKISINETFFSKNITNLEKKGSLINQINVEFKSINLNNKFKLPFKIPKNYTKILIDVK
jgi:hypothetical protein|tara:strand:+ start:1633 stop:2472 length:840 start_codon:yes stop_codon:yes gene_type:complete